MTSHHKMHLTAPATSPKPSTSFRTATYCKGEKGSVLYSEES
ncbi:MAG: hypothetical protein JWL58_7275 [Streptosporangiaceae bacterium]|jgi:hypothetical protein|nr:hypothetical protein [Streptosporangiaceae bacterium]